MTQGSTQRQQQRAAVVAALIVAVTASLWSPHRALAHQGSGKLVGTCSVANASGRASMTVTVANAWNQSVHNLKPSDILGSATGSATFFVQTSPRPLRELLPGKNGQFVWKGRFYGDGLLDLSVQVEGTFEDDGSNTTGIVNCNRVVVGNPDPDDPTPEPGDPTPTAASGDPTPTNTARADTPRPTGTAGRPTRTPITPRPTRTPRLEPTDTPTRVPPSVAPTNTAVARPSRTPIPPRPTRTPNTSTQATRTPVPPRPTRTPNIDVQPTRTPIVRPTRTPPPTATVRQPSSTPTRALPTRTPTRPVPTRTPIPPRPTRTPAGPPAQRPTRTPNDDPPPPTPVTPVVDGGLTANCSLRRNNDSVTVTMIVDNRTGADLREVRASTLQLDPEGGALFFDRTGPSPGAVAGLRNGVSVSFQWTGRLSPAGTMGFSAFATATGPNGPLQTPLADCGVTSNDHSEFDPEDFTGSCNISASQEGSISVQVNNGTREALTNVQAFFVSKTSTGTAAQSNLRGPAPRSVSSMVTGARREFVFGSTFLGDGEITMRFKARGTRPNTATIETVELVCTARVGGSGGNLPDLGVDAGELQESLLIETKNFGGDDCAVVEGCVDGLGQRKLLRFNTVTPNYGPGDVFLGDPVDNPEFIYSSCHRHYHFTEYADYRLMDMGGNIVARGHKQAFCLVDLWQPPGLGGDPRPQFPDCGFQGISAGWADVYHRGLDCQWIDITGVPSGRYVLEVQINPAHVIQEHNYQNNVGRAEVNVP